MSEENLELSHHGILGMKWGIRRYQNSDGTLTAAGRKRLAKQEAKAVEKQDKKNEKEVKKRNAKAIKNRELDIKRRRGLTDKDIESKIRRLESEKRMKDLTENDIEPGRAMLKRCLAKAGERVLTTALQGAMAYGLNAVTSGEFDRKTLASYIAPNPNGGGGNNNNKKKNKNKNNNENNENNSNNSESEPKKKEDE